jgi:hypothetical protein
MPSVVNILHSAKKFKEINTVKLANWVMLKTFEHLVRCSICCVKSQNLKIMENLTNFESI